MGMRPQSFQDQALLHAEKGVEVPHEFPGQDPEGGSECEYMLSPEDSSNLASTPMSPTEASAGMNGGGLSDGGVSSCGWMVILSAGVQVFECLFELEGDRRAEGRMLMPAITW